MSSGTDWSWGDRLPDWVLSGVGRVGSKQGGANDTQAAWNQRKPVSYPIQWTLDLADNGLAENLCLKDTLKKIWATIFDF